MSSSWTSGRGRHGALPAAVAVAVAVALLIALPAAAGAAAGWTRAAPMSVDRKAHTQTVLPGGDVLVTGGQALDFPYPSLDAVERYHPATDTWTTAAPMGDERLSQTATLLNDGRVLVVGGLDADDVALASAELYDPVANTWTPAAPMATGRRGHSATLLQDGRVLVAGGSGLNSTTAMTSSELYDPVANTWTPAAPMAERRRLFATVPLPGGDVLAAGGYYRGFTGATSVERYHPATDTWTTVAPMAVARADFPLVTLRDGRLLAVGGDGSPMETDTTELYDAVANTWTPAPTMAVARWANSATVLSGGDVLATGTQNLTELLTPGAAAWRTAGALPVGVGLSYEQRLLLDGRVLLTGSCSCGDATANVSLYTPQTTAEALPLDFGDAYVGHRSPLLWATVENSGREPLFVDRADVTGAGAAAFAVERETCTDGAVAPGGRCRVAVRFTPAAEGAVTAALELADNDDGDATVVALDGAGIAAPAAGRDGTDGDDGAAGRDGTNGRDGASGPAGSAGRDGATGATGPAGASGRDGATGPAGAPGPAGTPGPAGPAGTSALPRVTCASKLLRARGRGKLRVQTTCRVTLARPAARKATVRLRSRGRTLARATVRKGSRTLVLRVVTAAKPRGAVTAEMR